MTSLHRLGAGLVLAAASGAGWPQAAPAAAPAASAAAGPPAAARDPAAPVVTVIEDDGVRIEETRLRGQPRRITIQSKVGGVRAYEVIVGPGGRDPSQDRGAVGQRAWSLFDF